MWPGKNYDAISFDQDFIYRRTLSPMVRIKEPNAASILWDQLPLYESLGDMGSDGCRHMSK
jgi:hypothetical protein